MLCDVCISIDFFVKKHKQYPHHANLHAVYQAAEQGCELCQALLVNVEDAALGRIPVEVEMESRVFYHIWYWKGNDFNYFSHEWDPPVEGVHLIEFSGERTGRKQCWEAIFEVYVEHGCAPGLARAVSGRPIFPTPDSEGCFSLINSWMRECSERHKGYCPSQIEAPLPTRVLDIGMDGGDGGIFLKFTNFAEVGAYVTLSHCVSLIHSVWRSLFVLLHLIKKCGFGC
jgi:hypothetical protein